MPRGAGSHHAARRAPRGRMRRRRPRAAAPPSRRRRAAPAEGRSRGTPGKARSNLEKKEAGARQRLPRSLLRVQQAHRDPRPQRGRL
jgi:hypothetical protein